MSNVGIRRLVEVRSTSKIKRDSTHRRRVVRGDFVLKRRPRSDVNWIEDLSMRVRPEIHTHYTHGSGGGT